MTQLVVPFGLAMLAGVSLIIQQVLNANLRTEIDSAAWSGFASYFVGLLSMALFALALREAPPSLALASRVPWWAWMGGLFGAIFIALSIYLVPVLGAATFVALLVTGQMLGAATFDHFGWLGVPQQTFSLTRLLGIALLVAGVVLMRR
jgi:transporter family-2 protein